MKKFHKRQATGCLALPLVVLCSLSLSACSSQSNQVTINSMQKPTMVAHRGGALIHPESSMESFLAVAKSKFPMEMDLRRLADGTLVPQHDAVVDRNMIGITGSIGSITTDQWMASSIKHPGAGPAGTPTTWNEILDVFGGRVVLVPELKAPTSKLHEFAESIIERNLQGSVIVQSFDYEVCQVLAGKGLTVLYLFGTEEPDPSGIKGAGIAYVGPNKESSQKYLASLKDAGLQVWPWTVNSAEDARSLINLGVDGMFTDDPWTLSESIN